MPGLISDAPVLTLRMTSEDRLAFISPLRDRAVALGFLGGGCITILVTTMLIIPDLLKIRSRMSLWNFLYTSGVPLAGGPLFVYVGLILWRSTCVLFDRASGVVRGAGLKVGAATVREIPLRLVGAIQVCSGTVLSEGRKADHYDAQQINLILTEPEGTRVPLIAHAQSDRILADARQLARFLKVPLVDHS